MGVGKGPVGGDPAISKQAQGDGHGLGACAYIRVGEHHIVDRPQQRDLVAGHFTIVAQDGADGAAGKRTAHTMWPLSIFPGEA